MTLRRILIALLLATAGTVVSACGPAAARASDQERYDRWIEYYKQVAAEYDIRLDDGRWRALELRAGPVHVYHHPNGAGLKEQLGAIFVWTRDGRPEAFGALWSYPLPPDSPTRRNIVHEFQSLSLSPLTAVRDGRTFWSPREAGVELRPIPDAPPPAASRGLRLAQMRALARQFSGFNEFFGKEQRLRLTAQPLYRYEIDGPGGDVLDGAVFVYFVDWDPELVLSIEARKSPGDGEYQWHYAAARFSDKALRLEHNGRQVWTGPVVPQVEHRCGAADQPFFAVHGVDQHEIE